MTADLVLVVLGLAAGFLLLADLRAPQGRVRGGPPAVSVVIPARNEAASLPNLLRSLRGQTHPPGEVIVVDDDSSDDTAAIAAAAGATVVHSAGPPQGWVGKTWACHLGADHAVGDVLVFLDADVVLAPDGLERIVACWQRKAPAGLLSVQPFHTTGQAYEQLSAYPNLVAMMATGAFAAGRQEWSPVAFGPCLVTSEEAYRAVGGHETVAGEVIEDVHLARAYGSAGRPVRTRAGGSAISFRMYPEGLRTLVEGWSKNLAGGPRLLSAAPVAGAVLWLVASAVVASDLVKALVGAAGGGAGGAGALAVPVAMGAATAAQLAWFLRRIGRFRWWAAPAFPLLLAGFVALFLHSMVHRTVRGSVTWRGREVEVTAR